MTVSIDTANAYPLSWPEGTPRTSQHKRTAWRGDLPPFGQALSQLLAELRRLGVRGHDVIVSTDRRLRADGLPNANHRAPSDSGVVVWFRLDGQPRVFACDRYRNNEGSLRAITKTIEVLRGIDRWGVGQRNQAFAGYTALPPSASDAVGDPWMVLGLDRESSTPETVRTRYRQLAKERHPDQATGSAQAMAELTVARDAALKAIDVESSSLRNEWLHER